MTGGLRRIRGALGMSVIWAIGWALAGVLIGVTSLVLPGLPWDAFFRVFDAPLPALAIPGFIGGALFSVVLGIAGRRRRFNELSLPRFALWGAVAGLLLSLVPAALVAVGLATVGRPDIDLWQITAAISGPLTVLSAVSASGSLALARRAQRQELHEGGEEATQVGSAGAQATGLDSGGD